MIVITYAAFEHRAVLFIEPRLSDEGKVDSRFIEDGVEQLYLLVKRFAFVTRSDGSFLESGVQP